MALLTALILLYGTRQVSPEPLFDEAIYLKAFQAVADQTSPFEVDGYLYPPAFAHGGAVLVRAQGAKGAGYTMRGLNAASLAFVLVVAMAWFQAAGGGWAKWIWVVSASLVAVSNGVRSSMACNNVSFFAGGLLVAALVVLRRRPRVAGCLLALSVSTKPFAAPAILALAVAGFRTRRRHYLSASLIALFVGLGMNLASPWIGGMAQAAPNSLAELRSTSLYRLGTTLGFEIGRLPWLAVGLVGTAVVAWVWAERTALLYGICLLGVLIMPVVWNHSLILLVPLLGVIWGLSHARLLQGHIRPFELWIPALATLVLLFFESGSVRELRFPMETLVLAMPWLAGLALFFYQLILDPEPDDHSSGDASPVEG